MVLPYTAGFWGQPVFSSIVFQKVCHNSGLVKTGVPAPAVILEVQDTGVSMNNSMQARLTLHVTPVDRPPFQALATTFVNRFQVGMLVPGAAVQVKYDPNDITKVAVESLSAGGMGAVKSKRPGVHTCQDQYYEQLRRTGEEALATIVAANETNIRATEGGSVFRFTLDVKPRMANRSWAETQAAIADQSRAKLFVGKQYMSVTIPMEIKAGRVGSRCIGIQLQQKADEFSRPLFVWFGTGGLLSAQATYQQQQYDAPRNAVMMVPTMPLPIEMPNAPNNQPPMNAPRIPTTIAVPSPPRLTPLSIARAHRQQRRSQSRSNSFQVSFHSSFLSVKTRPHEACAIAKGQCTCLYVKISLRRDFCHI